MTDQHEDAGMTDDQLEDDAAMEAVEAEEHDAEQADAKGEEAPEAEVAGAAEAMTPAEVSGEVVSEAPEVAAASASVEQRPLRAYLDDAEQALARAMNNTGKRPGGLAHLLSHIQEEKANNHPLLDFPT